MDSDARMLVVGGGISGLVCAAALSRAGFTVQLVEREPHWPASGAGLSIQPNGLRALAEAGLRTRVESAGYPIDHWLFADDQGTVLCDIDLADVWGATGRTVGITRRDLQDALVDAVGGFRHRLGVSVSHLDERADAVGVTFTDGTADEFAVVVGADGIRSVVRRLAFGPVEPTFAGHVSWRSIAPVRLEGRPDIEFWLGDGRFFGLCPVAGDRTYGFGHVYRPKGRDPESGRLQRLRDHFAGFGPSVQQFLQALTDDRDVHCSAIEWVEQDQWHTGRVALLGDAAHAASPLMGQGGSLAIEDAVVIAEELARAPTPAAALAAYQARRQPRVGWVQQQSRAVAETMAIAPDRRNALLAANGASAFTTRYQPLVDPP